MQYLTNKGEHIVFYKVKKNDNVYIKKEEEEKSKVNDIDNVQKNKQQQQQQQQKTTFFLYSKSVFSIPCLPHPHKLQNN